MQWSELRVVRQSPLFPYSALLLIYPCNLEPGPGPLWDSIPHLEKFTLNANGPFTCKVL